MHRAELLCNNDAYINNNHNNTNNNNDSNVHTKNRGSLEDVRAKIFLW